MPDLKYVFLLDYLIPLKPPRRALWAQKCEYQCMLWSPGRSIFRSFFRFDFGLDFGLVLGPFWARLGRLLGLIWELKSGQVGPKMHLEAVFVQKSRCLRNIGKRKVKTLFGKMGPRWPQDRSKTGPRAIKKSCIFRLDF